MKVLIMVVIAFVFIQCTSRQNEKSENFDWLLGKWQRTNEAAAKRTFENWSKINDSTYTGFAFTLQKDDTINQEKMNIIKTDDNWKLRVKTPDEKDFISFEMSTINVGQFECKNDSLPFPNRIKYWRDGEQLKATVSGDSLQIPFEFKKL